MATTIDDLVALAKQRGLFWPAAELYGGAAGFYDYGPLGLRMRNNLLALWRKTFVDGLGAYEVDTAILNPQPVFKASGHIDSFTDPVIVCASCKTANRADKLLEEFYTKKKDPNNIGRIEKMGAGELEKELKANAIKCPKCGNALAGKVEVFNLLFKTAVGAGGNEPGYLRPETPQGIFVDFKYLFRTYSMKLPVAIAQTGTVYRNEISPRQQLIRMREFRQMDIELFFDPDDESVIDGPDMDEALKEKIPVLLKGSKAEETVSIKELLSNKTIPNRHFAMLLYLENRFVKALGIKQGSYRFRNVEVTPHYSKCNFDLELKTSFGYVELSGLAYRTDYDLTSHAKLSGEDLSVLNGEKKVLAHIVELSIGVDRPLFAVLDASLEEGKDRGWKWLRLSDALAPYRCAVFPLQKDEALTAKAKEIYKSLSGMDTYYSETGSIGKRYARADEVGTLFCITVDYDTVDKASKDFGTVTVRSRDDTTQVRLPVKELPRHLAKANPG